MNVSSSSILVFVVSTIFYFGFLILFPRSLHTIITVLYLCITIGIQTIFSNLHLRTMCGSSSIRPLFVWGVLPWLLIFTSLKIVLIAFPSWKMPFSNTFGYLIVSVMGINSILSSLMKPKFQSNDQELNRIIAKIFEDKSLLVNQFTPENFDGAIQRIEKVLDKNNPQYSSLIEKLRFRVEIKDYISQFIWFILTGVLTISISNMGILSSECVKSPEQIEADINSYQQRIQEASEETDLPVYKIRD